MYFFSLRKKGHFRVIFRDGQRSVAEPGPTPSPWSINYTFDENNYEFYQVAESPVLMTKTSSCLVSTLTGSDLLLTTEPQTQIQ